MPALRLNPYPKDRPHHLYVNLSFDERAAEMNLSTGRVTIHLTDHASEAASLIVAWCTRNPHLVAAARNRRRAHVEPSPGDLAHNKPGQNLIAPEREARERDRRRSKAWAYAMELTRIDAGLPFRLGIKGERRVARVIDRHARRGAWRAIHSIPLGRGGDIDHLIIGNDGVVVVDTKFHHKAKMSVSSHGVWINGARTDHVETARRLASLVSDALSEACDFDVRATPMVALVNGGAFAPDLTRSGRPDDVLVGTNLSLPRVLWDVEDGLTDEQVEAIYEAARRPATWADVGAAK